MATEEYSTGYEAGYQDGWNKALAEQPEQGGAGCVLSNDDMHPTEEIAHLKDLLGKANALARIRAERIKELEAQAGAEPVAWAGYDLDGMVEAFNRVIESHAHRKNPFHNPIDADALMALRILRRIVPAMKRFTAPKVQPTRVPLTDKEIKDCIASTAYSFDPVDIARAAIAAYEAKNGIGGGK